MYISARFSSPRLTPFNPLSSNPHVTKSSFHVTPAYFSAQEPPKNGKPIINASSLNLRELVGDLTPTNELRALAKKSDLKAICTLAIRYGKGINGAEKDHNKALNLWKMASKLGFGAASFQVSQYFLREKNDLKKAFKWCKIASNQGYSGAYRSLGVFYNSLNDDKNAFKCFLLAANQGDSEAQLKVGNDYFHGTSVVKKDLQKAIKWYKNASEQGNPEAQYLLGLAYMKGEGVRGDLKMAFYWLCLAAEKLPKVNLTLAHYYLLFSKNALSYCHYLVLALGNSVDGKLKKDISREEQLKNGCEIAQLMCGIYLEMKIAHCFVDYDAALEFYSAAARKGNQEAVHRIVQLFCSGKVNLSEEEANEWILKASEITLKEEEMKFYALKKIVEGLEESEAIARFLGEDYRY